MRDYISGGRPQCDSDVQGCLSLYLHISHIEHLWDSD